MKYRIKTRDFKGNYEDLDDVRGWYFVGGEEEIETQSDSRALVFTDSFITSGKMKKKKFDLTAQEAYDLYLALDSEDEVNGYTFDSEDENTIVKVNK